MTTCLQTNQWRANVDFEIAGRLPTSGTAKEVSRMFGLSGSYRRSLYDDFSLSISAGEITAVIGTSGSGKSVLLREIATQSQNVFWLGELSEAESRRAVIDLLHGGTLRKRLEILSLCGLAEATLLVSPAGLLSAGQQYRLSLARAICSALASGRPALILADEFCSQLDWLGGAILCRQVRRLANRYPLAIVAATPRVDLLDSLRPDAIVRKPLGEPPTVEHCSADAWDDELDFHDWPVEQGSIEDYRKLEGFHYIAGPPAAHKRVYVIRTPRRFRMQGGPELAGVLVVSPPVISVRGRNMATCGRYVGGCRSGNLARLNREMETISRVIVHPIFRGAGMAVRLVQHALDDSEMRYVEALAAMGKVNPFFERAGMKHAGIYKGPSQYYHYYIYERF